jgi:hypothetical protein
MDGVESKFDFVFLLAPELMHHMPYESYPLPFLKLHPLPLLEPLAIAEPAPAEPPDK